MEQDDLQSALLRRPSTQDLDGVAGETLEERLRNQRAEREMRREQMSAGKSSPGKKGTYGHSGNPSPMESSRSPGVRSLVGSVDTQVEKAVVTAVKRSIDNTHMRLYDAFLIMDKSKKGGLSRHELLQGLSTLNLGLDNESLRNFVKSVDVNESGRITFQEFFNVFETCHVDKSKQQWSPPSPSQSRYSARAGKQDSLLLSPTTQHDSYLFDSSHDISRIDSPDSTIHDSYFDTKKSFFENDESFAQVEELEISSFANYEKSPKKYSPASSRNGERSPRARQRSPDGGMSPRSVSRQSSRHHGDMSPGGGMSVRSGAGGMSPRISQRDGDLSFGDARSMSPRSPRRDEDLFLDGAMSPRSSQRGEPRSPRRDEDLSLGGSVSPRRGLSSGGAMSPRSSQRDEPRSPRRDEDLFLDSSPRSSQRGESRSPRRDEDLSLGGSVSPRRGLSSVGAMSPRSSQRGEPRSPRRDEDLFLDGSPRSSQRGESRSPRRDEDLSLGGSVSPRRGLSSGGAMSPRSSQRDEPRSPRRDEDLFLDSSPRSSQRGESRSPRRDEDLSLDGSVSPRRGLSSVGAMSPRSSQRGEPRSPRRDEDLFLDGSPRSSQRGESRSPRRDEDLSLGGSVSPRRGLSSGGAM
eukprot:CAMPEP_0203765386 /NCGR_PEP_ID=MMETSP0098-20131031/18388_1 /ASSEMBLY_ACC=CAM_ASM_000208 /TAXON_ID=96639 /ORGANISM=" , Strain NY0313808BC1" /LENGTH=632 /DNA_ID=CAMNT_0050661639 /DNA_START=24 /DNA_END=1919 /DNA_ORIENTATION=+